LQAQTWFARRRPGVSYPGWCGPASVGGDNDPVYSNSLDGRWTVVVPLKASVRGKSRIKVDPELRRALVLAMAVDTAAAASAAVGVGRVVVVVDDPSDGADLVELARVSILPTHRSGLNEALADGLQSLGPLAQGPVAVLPGDLPSLTADELDAALTKARAHPLAVVADRQGTGTTLLTAMTGGLLRPRYGTGSLGRHLAGGAVLLGVADDSGLRRDVDQVADLLDITGPRTLALLADAGWAPPLCDARPAS
jgi:2-phospho-L-lactate guanylyltransferase